MLRTWKERSKFPLPNKNLSFWLTWIIFTVHVNFPKSPFSSTINTRLPQWFIAYLLICYLETGLSTNYGEIASLFRIDLFSSPLISYRWTTCMYGLREWLLVTCCNILNLMTCDVTTWDACIVSGARATAPPRSLIDRGRSPDGGAGAVLVITWASRGWCNVGSINIWCQTRDLVMKCSVHS